MNFLNNNLKQMSRKLQVLGIEFNIMLFFIFLVLKLIGIGQVATWSWWWIISPLWIIPVFCLVVIMIFLIVSLIINLF